MKKLLPIILVVVLAFLCVSGVKTYNSLTKQEEVVKSAWSQVENQLQRRADLIPNLVNTVKGYASHEERIFTEVADARAKLAGAATPAETAEANGALNSALSRLLAISENYPALKADANFRQLQDELAGTENRIAVARKDYNDAARLYNTKVRLFPGNIFARLLGFQAHEYFTADAGSENAPEVSFE